ncbi:helix-turn-helix transcriptional regulator [Bordetella bronchiseptica]|uniref:Peptidase s24-like family protein n=1 Tax=Bordetella bronchiseptica 253 TaxID=568707 RepID=A0A0C6NZB4_BORBO|nr:peptidase s24-like family protein [Bordetella bronchiseptica 253]
MNEVELNEFRMVRLQAAVDHVSKGNKTDFGRRLGYKDGAFVRQMVGGIRPVTEKTIRAIESMPGMRGWFSPDEPSPPVADAPSPAPWPFPSISEEDVRALTPGQLGQLEGAIALAIGQLRLGVDVAPAQRKAAPSSGSGGLVDIDAAADEFPMRIPGLPPPWEGGKTTKQMEREGSLKLSLADSIIANVAAGDPPAANDRFEKVPELADVRLSAGDGIENHAEDQTGMIQFRRSFLRSVGADGGRARVVYAKGDSMEPVIRDGAALLVVPDEGLTLCDLAAGGIYAINYDGKMIVKAVAKDRLTGRWVARSFNDRYQDVPLENGAPVRVLGRVVWAGVRLG